MAALSSASDRDVPGWVAAWLTATGFDTIRVTHDGEVPVLTREGSRPHRISVRAYDESLARVETRMVDLANEPLHLDDWAGLVVVPNTHGETFARIRLDESSWSVVEQRLSSLDDPLTRAVLWASIFDLVRCGDLSSETFLDLVERHLPVESDVAIVTGVLDRARLHVLPRHVPADRAVAAQDRLAAACLAGLARSPADQLALALTAGLARSSRDPDLLRSLARP